MSSRGKIISSADFLIDGGTTASYWFGDLQYLKQTHQLSQLTNNLLANDFIFVKHTYQFSYFSVSMYLCFM